MRAARLTWRLVLPLTLMLLVVALGALQYRWLGQVSEAERAQLGRTLNQRAYEFAAEFDREISLVFTALSIDTDVLDVDPWTALGERYDVWRQRASVPTMIKALYLARSADGGHTLARWTPESRAGHPIDWPEHFEPAKRAITVSAPRMLPSPAGGFATIGNAHPPGGAAGAVFSLSVTPVVDTIPALIVPIATRPVKVQTEPDFFVALRSAGTDFIIVELDRQVLVNSFVPALVERFFPNQDSERYRVAVVDRSNNRIFSRGFGADEDVDFLHVDGFAPFFTGSRTDFTSRLLTESRLAWQTEVRRNDVVTRSAGSAASPTKVAAETLRSVTSLPQGGTMSFIVQGGPAGATGMPARLSLGGWRIMLRHQAGSLDAAVDQARTRNVATSFGILAVLMAGVGLIVINARKSEKLATQQMEFVATVSHELRTPLAVIRSAAQNLSAGVVDDPGQARRYGELIESEGRRLTDMVEEVLEFAGLSGNRRALALRQVDVAELAHEVVESHREALDASGIVTSVTVDASLAHGPVVMADEDALRRALNNLVANAIKYAADGKSIGIHVARDTQDGRDLLRVDVIDKGPGIAPQDLPRVFEPFYRGREVVDRQIHGNGLGLSLVARIAEAHGGTAQVASVPGEGATFTLRLPIVAATPA